jgi:hypothetical protein
MNAMPKTTWNVGARNPNAKLSDDEVRRLRAERKAGAKVATLAVRYRVSECHVSRLCAGLLRVRRTP